MRNEQLYNDFIKNYLNSSIIKLFTKSIDNDSIIFTLSDKEITIYLVLWDLSKDNNPRITCSFDYNIFENSYYEALDEYLESHYIKKFVEINNHLIALLSNKIIFEYLKYKNKILKITINFFYFNKNKFQKLKIITKNSIMQFFYKSNVEKYIFEYGPWL